MKCEICLELLEEYLDGELTGADQEHVNAHLIKCTGCAAAFATLTAEQELFARYDREIEVPAFLWTRIAAHSVSVNNQPAGWRAHFARLFNGRSASFAGTIAILLLAIAVGLVYLISNRSASKNTVAEKQTNPTPPRYPTLDQDQKTIATPDSTPKSIASKPRVRSNVNHVAIDQSDVLSSDLSYLDLDDQDTAKHIEQSQNLLRSIRNFPVSDGDEEIDVTYDKALSRRLLNENVVLRRDAEMKAKFPTKTLLADLEPFLIDIANLPDHARPEEMRVIKERVQRTEIVAALLDYQDRGANNR
jgi:hypothetical protein